MSETGGATRGAAPAVRRLLLVVALLIATAAATAALVSGLGLLVPRKVPIYFAVEGGCWLLVAAAVVLLARVPRRIVPAVVLGGTLLLGAAGASGPPTISTDAARYSWDGIVQDAGVSPYEYVPADAALSELRPDWLFSTASAAATGCPQPRGERSAQVGAPGTICTVVNRPHVPTIYPPMAEALFALARIAVPAGVAYLPVQLLGLAAVLATTGLLLRLLRRTGRPLHHAAVFGWCPFVTVEAVTNAHVDAAAAFLALAATALIVRGRSLAGGVVLGLAVATKFLPLIVAPPLGRARPWLIGTGAAGTVALVYAPHVLAVGPAVLGYLPGYLNEEGYDGGTRSVLLSPLLPGPLSTLTAVLLLAALAVLLMLRTDPASPWTAQTVMIGAALVLLSPAYAWYALLLVPFVAISGRWEWLGLVLVLSLLGVRHQDPVLFRGLLAAAALLPVVVGLLRRRRNPAPAVEETPMVTNRSA